MRPLPTLVVGVLGALVSALPTIVHAQSTPAAQPPVAQPPVAGGTNAGAPAARPVRESWTADRRNFQTGDIITILIDDYTISTAVKENIASDQRSRDLDAGASLPSGGVSKRVGLSTRNSAAQQQRGSARRENRFQNEMSVRVVGSGPNGLLQVRGTKDINVDKAQQNIELTGWVRAQDISSQNYVESNRVADIVIAYQSPGPLGKPKQGVISKVLGAIWP
jgi:flagellar L-ring protein precursor FlgH